jgi:hypothetical protein
VKCYPKRDAGRRKRPCASNGPGRDKEPVSFRRFSAERATPSNLIPQIEGFDQPECRQQDACETEDDVQNRTLSLALERFNARKGLAFHPFQKRAARRRHERKIFGDARVV